MRKFYYKIFFVILILRALDLFCFRHEVLLLLLITSAQIQIFPDFSRTIKVILSKIVFDFAVGLLSENVKYCLSGSITKVHMVVVFKTAIYTTSVCLTINGFEWASYTIGLINMCKNHEIFSKKVIICTLYSAIFNMLYMTGFISPLLMLTWSKFPPEVF